MIARSVIMVIFAIDAGSLIEEVIVPDEEGLTAKWLSGSNWNDLI